MKYLKDNGYTTVDLYDLKAYMEKRVSLPGKSVVLTFGRRLESVKNAIPIMKKYNFKATFFIVLEYIDGAYPPPDLGRVVGDRPDRNFDIGCHSHTHPWIPATI
jgi:peptidoglycan/xylan/chitin deacetylase (PgdA/CDA1 family)